MLLALHLVLSTGIAGDFQAEPLDLTEMHWPLHTHTAPLPPGLGDLDDWS